MSKSRIYLGWLCLVVLLGTIIYFSWGFDREESDSNTTRPSGHSSVNSQLLSVHTKIGVGALAYLKANSSKLTGHSVSPDMLTSQIKTSIRDLCLSKEGPSPILVRRFVVLKYFNYEEDAAELAYVLNSRLSSGSPDEVKLIKMIEHIYGLHNATPDPDLPQTLSVRGIEFLERELGWFSRFVILESSPTPGEKARVQAAIDNETLPSFKKFIVGIVVAGFVFLVGGLSLFCFFLYAVLRRPASQFKKASFESAYMLEVFCLYLLLMTVMPFVFRLFDFQQVTNAMLLINVVFMLLLPLVAFWPTLFGVRRSEIRQATGFHLLGMKQFAIDVLLSPFVYTGALLTLFVVILIYAGVAEAIGLDLTRGTHPVVPMLVSSEDSRTPLLIFFLAVVVAPFTEEVMFRGVFYSWLRARASATFSVFTSAPFYLCRSPSTGRNRSCTPYGDRNGARDTS